jgi:DNA-binding HxlR family transcriptional regulator
MKCQSCTLVPLQHMPFRPPRVEYEITEVGRSLAPVFVTLADWSDAHLNEVNEARRAFDASGRPRPS